MARLGLRASEVTRLRLEDVDWREAVLRVRARKTGHGALLPLTGEVGAAVADYLQRGRPDTPARQVFVLHRQRVGAPISDSIVGRDVDNALRRAGIEAPIRGANLLRHSLATGLLTHGAGLTEIADLLGHRSLATTRIYASVDVAALRDVALPFCVTSPPRTVSPRCPRRDCSARPGTAHRHTCIPTARSPTCCTPLPGCPRPAGYGRTAIASCSDLGAEPIGDRTQRRVADFPS